MDHPTPLTLVSLPLPTTWFCFSSTRPWTRCAFVGPNRHAIRQVQDAIYDGLRAVRNTIEDRKVVAGAGACELWLHHELMAWLPQCEGKYRLGVRAFADAVLVIPKTLALNSGLDPQQAIIDLQAAFEDSKAEGEEGTFVLGLDIESGKPIDPRAAGIWDNYSVKQFILTSSVQIASQILQIDEILSVPRQASTDPSSSPLAG